MNLDSKILQAVLESLSADELEQLAAMKRKAEQPCRPSPMTEEQRTRAMIRHKLATTHFKSRVKPKQ